MRASPLAQYRQRAVPGLLDKRLIFVTGKGGVGKSTVAIALGLLAARQGRRTIVAELAGQERVQRTFDHRAEHFAEVELAPGLFTISVDPQHAMEEYLRVKAGALGHALSAEQAVPGVRDGDARDARAAQHRQGLGARAAPASHPRRRPHTTS